MVERGCHLQVGPGVFEGQILWHHILSVSGVLDNLVPLIWASVLDSWGLLQDYMW